MSTKATTKMANPPRLITHGRVAKLVEMDTVTLRRRVARGEWPEPHYVLNDRCWYYRLDMIEHFIEHGTWPEGTRFKGGEGKGRAS